MMRMNWTCELWVVLICEPTVGWMMWCRNILIRTWPAASYCRMHATSSDMIGLAHNNTTKLLHSALIGKRTRIARLPDLWPHHQKKHGLSSSEMVPPTAVRVPAIYRPISTQYQTCGGVTWTMHAEQINQWVGMVGHTPLNFMVP